MTQLDAGAHLQSKEECSITAVGPELMCITNMAPPELSDGPFSATFAAMEFVVGTVAEVPRFPLTLSIMTVNGVCNLRLNYHCRYWTRRTGSRSCEASGWSLDRAGCGLTGGRPRDLRSAVVSCFMGTGDILSPNCPQHAPVSGTVASGPSVAGSQQRTTS